MARELRYKGESIGNISRLLGSAKSTVSLWCEDIFLSKLQKTLLIKRNSQAVNKGRQKANENKKLERLMRVDYYKTIGIGMIGKISIRELFLIGAALYWAEGGKNQRKVVFINSDHRMVLLWIEWAKICLNIPMERLTCRVEINDIHNYRLDIVEKYWSKITGIPLSQFRKASLKHSRITKIYDNSSEHFGCFTVDREKRC